MIDAKIQEAGLEDFLMKNGVSKETIEKSKQTYSGSCKELKKYYNSAEVVRTHQKIPVQDIYGTSRNTDNISWFNLLRVPLTGEPTNIDVNLEKDRLLEDLWYFDTTPIEDIRNWTEARQLRFLAFRSDTGIKYFQSGDGNHRTVRAKNIGLEYIGTNHVIYYDFDSEKYDYYQQIKELQSEFLDKLHKLGFKIDYDDDMDNYMIIHRITETYFATDPFSNIIGYNKAGLEDLLQKISDINKKLCRVSVQSVL